MLRSSQEHSMRVRSKANPELAGTIIDVDGDLCWVRWDDYEYPGQRWRIERDRVEEIPESLGEQLAGSAAISTLEHVRDHVNDEIARAIELIQRAMKK